MKNCFSLLLFYIPFSAFSQSYNSEIINSENLTKVQKRNIHYSDGTTDDHNDVSLDITCVQILSGINNEASAKINAFIGNEIFLLTNKKVNELELTPDTVKKVQQTDTITDTSWINEHTDSDSAADSNQTVEDYYYYEHTSANFRAVKFNGNFITFALDWMHESKGGGGGDNYTAYYTFDITSGNRIKLSDIIDSNKQAELEQLISQKIIYYPVQEYKTVSKVDFSQSPITGMNYIGFYMNTNDHLVFFSLDEIKDIALKNGKWQSELYKPLALLSKKITNRNQKHESEFIVLQVYVNNIEERLKKYLLKNKVKEIHLNYNNRILKSFDVSDEGINRAGQVAFKSSQCYTWDYCDKHLERFTYSSDNQIKYKYDSSAGKPIIKKLGVMFYDGQHNTTHVVNTDYDWFFESFYSNNDSITFIEFGGGNYMKQYYDRENKITKKELFDSCVKEFTVKYTYNQKRMLSTMVAYRNKNDSTILMSLKYDGKNRITEYKGTNGPLEMKSFFADLKGYFGQQFDFYGTYKFQYDKKGNVATANYNDNRILYFTYDKKNNLISIRDDRIYIGKVYSSELTTVGYTYY